MRINEQIESHKNGKVTFLKMDRPQFVCESDDDYIEYINYYWSFINKASFDISTLSFFNDEDHIDIAHLAQEVGRAHGLLELCHKFLSGKSLPVTKKVSSVFTTTMSHERRA